MIKCSHFCSFLVPSLLVSIELNLFWQVPSLLHQSFLSWKKSRSTVKSTPPLYTECPGDFPQRPDSVSFPAVFGTQEKLITKSQTPQLQAKNRSNGRIRRLHPVSQIPLHLSVPVNPKRSRKLHRARNHAWLHTAPESELDTILSLHTPVHYLEQYKDEKIW